MIHSHLSSPICWVCSYSDCTDAPGTSVAQVLISLLTHWNPRVYSPMCPDVPRCVINWILYPITISIILFVDMFWHVSISMTFHTCSFSYSKWRWKLGRLSDVTPCVAVITLIYAHWSWWRDCRHSIGASMFESLPLCTGILAGVHLLAVTSDAAGRGGLYECGYLPQPSVKGHLREEGWTPPESLPVSLIFCSSW